MSGIILVGMAIVLLFGLIAAEKSGVPGRILLFKTPLSFLFIIAWWLLPYPNKLAFTLVGAALTCCLCGDILLAFGSRVAFLLGLVSFFMGHVLFASIFFIMGTTGTAMALGAMLMVVSAGIIWRWLAPHLGDMTTPVLAYLVVISIMVCGAWSILSNTHIPHQARVGILIGASLFYLSDIAVARQRFVTSDHRNRMVGLPLYYGAQFILVFSSSWIPA
ncbi:conserved uncharacterized protein, YhhN-like [Desulfosarcina variabilis str. Montpellier]|uniref:lysoplasmalogenase n=1 Tax=Desulfosarcina variabilis TaxID=2300 RepID=UPI003AFA4EAB